MEAAELLRGYVESPDGFQVGTGYDARRLASVPVPRDQPALGTYPLTDDAVSD